MADCAASDVSEGPVLSLLNKRLRALRKKQNRILQMEEAISQGKPINKEQEEVLRSKPAVSILIDELEKLRQPLSQAVSEELSLAAQRQQLSSDSAPASTVDPENSNDDDDHHQRKNDEPGLRIDEDLLHLLYFGSLFDVKSQSDFTATILTRTHERGCCLTYDYVTDDATDLLGERDLNSLSALGGLLISRPVDSGLSHKNALQRCIEHAKLWLANSDQPIESNSNLTYSDLRERLNKIMASDYFTTTPEMKDPVEVAAGNYASFQVPMSAPSQVEGSVAEFHHSDQNSESFQGHETGDDESSPVDELQKDEERENAAEIVSVQQEQTESQAELEHSEIDSQSKVQQYIPRRMYQNQRGGRGGSGGGRRGYSNSNGRGGRGSGRGGGTYVNGRNQYYEQPGNYYPRNYNNRGRGGRGGGQYYNNHSSAVPGGHSPADVGVRS